MSATAPICAIPSHPSLQTLQRVLADARTPSELAQVAAEPLRQLSGAAVVVLDRRNGVLAAAASRAEQRELRRALRTPEASAWTIIDLGDGVGSLATKGSGEGSTLLAEALRDAYERLADKATKDRARHAHRVRAPEQADAPQFVELVEPVTRTVWSAPEPIRQAALDGQE